MNEPFHKKYEIDVLAEEAGGYFSPPTEENIAYTDLLFDVCKQFGIRYSSASAKERYFVEEVTRVTWAVQQERKSGVKHPIRPAFSSNQSQSVLPAKA